VQATADPNDTALSDPALLVRMASAATVAPQSQTAARPARRPQVPVVECARAVHQTAQAIGTAPALDTAQALGTVAPSNQAAPAAYHAPTASFSASPTKTPGATLSREKNAPRSLIAPPLTVAPGNQPRTYAVEPIGVFVPAGK
jgi:hypothetical protein